ncbi:MAG TPA: YfhO family protein [Blastocatellia bacterium]|nr:YfhO family protein [Blastocatellia bacterium]
MKVETEPLSLLERSSSVASSGGSHAVSIAVLVLAVVALFWRVFFLGETLVDVATLNNQLPWGYYAGQTSDYPYNRRDLTDTYVTRDYFVASAYGDGELPLWNPFNFAGHPIYADGVTRTLSPFLLFYTFLDVPTGYTVARITELLLAALFLYLFLIKIGASPNGALVGSLVFALSSHSMLHLTGLGWWGGLMWLPLIFLFADRAVTRRRYTDAALAGVFLALQFFCGYMPNQVYYIGALVLYYLFLAFYKPVKRPAIRRRVFVMILITIGVGLALAATQWMPVLELLGYSNRRIVPTESGYIYLPPWYLATLVFPTLFGSAYDAHTVKLFTALNVSHDHSLYVGIPALLASLFALHRLWRNRARGERETEESNRRLVFFAFLAAFALFIITAAPLYVHVTRFIPVLQTIRVIVRGGVLFIFAASALAAFGTDLILKSTGEQLSRTARIWRRVVIAAIVFIAAGAVVSYALRLTGSLLEPGAEYEQGGGYAAFAITAVTALADQFMPPDAGLFIPLAIMTALLVMLRLASAARLRRQLLFAILVALLVADLFWNSRQYEKSYPAAQVFPRTEITDFLRAQPPGRVLVAPSDMESNRRASTQPGGQKIIAPPNTLLPYKIATVSGKDQLYPRSYREYSSLVEPQPYLSHVVFDETRSPFLDLLNVTYLLTHEAAAAPAGYELLKTAEGVSVYKNQNAAARAFFAESVVEVLNSSETLAAMREPSFDPRTTVVVDLSRLPSIEASADFKSLTGSQPSTATIIEDRRNRVVIETVRGKDGLMVLSDNYYPGWRAFVDGQEVSLLRANHTMRAVRVPAGSHVVSFEFAPQRFREAVYISSIAAAFLAGAFLLAAFRRNAGNQE